MGPPYDRTREIPAKRITPASVDAFRPLRAQGPVDACALVLEGWNGETFAYVTALQLANAERVCGHGVDALRAGNATLVAVKPANW